MIAIMLRFRYTISTTVNEMYAQTIKSNTMELSKRWYDIKRIRAEQRWLKKRLHNALVTPPIVV